MLSLSHTHLKAYLILIFNELCTLLPDFIYLSCLTDSLTTRGEKLELLVNKAENLNNGVSSNFYPGIFLVLITHFSLVHSDRRAER